MAMSKYLLVLQQQANDFNAHLVMIQEVILLLIGATCVWLYVLLHGNKRSNA